MHPMAGTWDFGPLGYGGFGVVRGDCWWRRRVGLGLSWLYGVLCCQCLAVGWVRRPKMETALLYLEIFLNLALIEFIYGFIKIKKMGPLWVF